MDYYQRKWLDLIGGKGMAAGGGGGGGGGKKKKKESKEGRVG